MMSTDAMCRISGEFLHKDSTFPPKHPLHASTSPSASHPTARRCATRSSTTATWYDQVSIKSHGPLKNKEYLFEVHRALNDGQNISDKRQMSYKECTLPLGPPAECPPRAPLCASLARVCSSFTSSRSFSGKRMYLI